MTSVSASPARPMDCSDAERDARIELALAYRWAHHQGWSTFIYNHITARVPDEPGMFLIKRHDALFKEVSASTLVKLSLDGTPAPGYEQINVAGFNIHAALLRARPDLGSVMHMHPLDAVAVSAHGTELLPLCQTSMRFYQRISYHDYEGLSEDSDECARLAANLGPRNKAMILRNHGLLTCGASVSQAIYIMGQLITACQVQRAVLSMQGQAHLPPVEVCEHTARQWEAFDQTGARANLHAYMRVMDAIDPGYRN
ncbi:MAG: class II aldolase/adducin family protein [Lautropia sp.]